MAGGPLILSCSSVDFCLGTEWKKSLEYIDVFDVLNVFDLLDVFDPLDLLDLLCIQETYLL